MMESFSFTASPAADTVRYQRQRTGGTVRELSWISRSQSWRQS